MTTQHWINIGARGRVTIPTEIRRNLGLRKGDLLIFEETGGGVFITPLRNLVMTNPAEAQAFMDEHGLTPDDLVERDKAPR